MEALEQNQEIEFREQKVYKVRIENNPFFVWEKAPRREIYHLKSESFSYFFYVLEHDFGIKIPDIQGRREIADIGFFYVTYKLSNGTYVQIFIETDNPEKEEINVTIWLFFFW